jgi:2,3-bisphosphoglycerate-independent phosphoglycerate mutase
MQRRRPVMLVILDGFGWREDAADNAVRQAKTPTFDRLWQSGPRGFLRTSGKDVGLPDGQMGNSEVGHLNIGAGRVVVQDLPRIGAAIASGEMARAPALTDLIAKLKNSGGTCHLLGLVSPGGVHSHQGHAVALAKILAAAGVPTLLHALTDGRDTPPQSAADDLKRLLAALPKTASIATVAGRYYAMDRDKRWDRVEKAYNAIVEAAGPRFADAPAVVADAYAHKKFDEFIVPAVVDDYRGMKDGDGVLCFNFRADRVREILSAMLDPNFSGFARKRAVHFAAAVGMAQYSDELDKLMATIFPPQPLANILGEIVSEAGRTQLRMAETEKYPHVTYFLNGGREEPYAGEDRIMVPSPKVATYDLQPEMSAPELTDKAVAAINSGKYDRYGGPHRQPAGRRQGGGDGRCGLRPHRAGGRKIGRRAPCHRRPRQLRDDARPGDRRAAYRTHHEPGAGHAGRRAQSRAQRRRPARRHRADAARADGIAEAQGDDRHVALARGLKLRLRHRLLRCHALLGQFLFCFLVLGQVRQPHATQHIGRLGELNVVVTNDLYAVAPGIAKIKELTIEYADTSRLECLAGRLLVVNHEAKVATIVRRLPATLLKRNKLIAQVDESHGVALAAQFEAEETTVERQRLFDIPYLQRNVVEADNARFRELSHRNLLCGPEELNG